MCDNIRPRLIIDLGSGFSSYVLRRFQLYHEATVYSVDDDPFWLDQTREFLLYHRLSTNNLCLWDQLPFFEDQSGTTLILHDLGNPQKRIQALPQLLKFISTPAHLILDDIHKPIIRNSAMGWIRMHSLHYVDLAPYSKDDFGRFQWYVPLPSRRLATTEQPNSTATMK
jgi:hypothetical protein